MAIFYAAFFGCGGIQMPDWSIGRELRHCFAPGREKTRFLQNKSMERKSFWMPLLVRVAWLTRNATVRRQRVGKRGSCA
jgi:hypothetical protein